MPPSFLTHAQLDDVIRLAPLVAIDLIIRNRRGEVLLGLRNNEPAKGCYFVPGGMIVKNERLTDAFTRIVKNETNWTAHLEMHGSLACSSISTTTTDREKLATAPITWCSAMNLSGPQALRRKPTNSTPIFAGGRSPS
jgi:8-oxo-dGTP pyrophosphatase MutT (NUDIX family)